MNDDLERIGHVPDEAIVGGHDGIEWISNQTIIVRYTGPDGTVYSEQYVLDEVYEATDNDS